MSTLSLPDASAQWGEFYVPRFEIRIEGAGLEDDVLRDVTEVTYTDDIEKLDHFQITVNNWDETRNRFKYIGAETETTLNSGDKHSQLFKLFEPCSKEVKLSMGYGSKLTLLLTGTFTTMEPQFSASAAPTLNVRGLNLLHQLRRKKYDDAFFDQRDSEIARTIAGRRDRQLRAPRFPLAVRTLDSAESSEERIEFVAQKKEYDIDFLWRRARKRGYVLVLEEETDDHPRQIYFGPSSDTASRVTYALEWGKSLIQFNPRLTTANQYKSVTVNGWNRGRQKPISVTVDFNDRKLNRLNPDLHSMIRKCDPRENHVVDKPVFSERQARELARGLLLDQHKQMVKVSATTVGLPELRAGSNVEISGVGSRLGGTYFVTQTEHVLNDSGYTTKFQARRENTGQPAEKGSAA